MEDASDTARYVVYLLVNDVNPCTYVGCTNNLVRRLRQHNGELVGGARYTSRHGGVAANAAWRVYGYVPNLEKHEALSLEKRIQIRSRRMPDRHAVDRRLRAVIEILSDYPDRGYEFVVASDATISGASSDP